MKRSLAAALAACALAGLPAAAAPRADDPYPCGVCLFEIGVGGAGFRIVAGDSQTPGLGGIVDLAPDRTRMLFARAGEEGLYVSALDGGGARRVTDGGRDGVFSPDGTKVAFTRRSSSCASEVAVAAVDGSGDTTVARCAAYPAWAADSKRLAFVESLSPGADSGWIAVGAPARRIAFWEGGDSSGGVDLTWSPRGDTLAYVTAREPARPRAMGRSAGGRAADPPAELRLVRADGRSAGAYADAYAPAWAPDGRRIAFDHAGSPYELVPFSLAPGDDVSLEVAAAGGRARRGYGSCGAPTWSPDGRRIACLDDAGCRGDAPTAQVFVVPAAGGRPRRVTCLRWGGEIRRLWWSRDGTRLLFSWDFTQLDSDPPSRAAVGAPRNPPGLSAARVCTSLFFGGELWDETARECAADVRGRLTPAPVYDCSVRYRTTRPAGLTARLLYDGRVQRTDSATVHGSGTRGIGIGFAAVPDDAALPAGSYACEFSLGARRVRMPFRARGPAAPVLFPLACRTAATYEHACSSYSGRTPTVWATHSVTCSALFARRQGHRVAIEILRGRTLLYAARDVLRYPITSEWAHVSAPRGRPLTPGGYRCRFRVDGRLAAAKAFTVLG